VPTQSEFPKYNVWNSAWRLLIRLFVWPYGSETFSINIPNGDFMDAQYWLKKWNDESIAFHQADVNKRLKTFWPEVVVEPVNDSKPPCVFVPLCGKSLDMLWLQQQGLHVLGVELSEKAAVAFFDENQLTYEHHTEGKFAVYSGTGKASGIRILVGDFFSLTLADISGCRYLYDRASLIAMNREMRADYTKHLSAICVTGLRGLLLAISYDQSKMQGPPFSVSDRFVHENLGKFFDIQELAHFGGPERVGNLGARGLETLDERVYLLVRKS